MHLRAAELTDAPAIQAIYAPYVAETTISFEEVPPDTDEVQRRIKAISRHHPYLVAERAGVIAGYAYASQHRRRPAYRHSVDVAVYVAGDAHRQGVGRALLEKLIHAVTRQGHHAAFAGIALPNSASIGLHEELGFEQVGIYRQVGRKFGKWIDVGWWQRLL